MKRVMIPLDGSEFAERALDPALRLVSRVDGEAHLISVVSDLPPVPLATGDGELVSRWFEEEEERARGYLSNIEADLADRFPGVSVTAHVQLGPVARTIEAYAEEIGIDLVALTTHGRGAWQRAWLGSVADQLLRKASRPILLLRDGDVARILFERSDSPSHVLVPFDGSDASRLVFDTLNRLGGERTRVSLVTVLHQPFPLATSYLPHAISDERLLTERKSRASEALEGVADSLRDAGWQVETRVLVADDVARGLLSHAEEGGVDLIAIATRGRGGISRFLLGSVADKVVRGASMPVLMARRPAGEE